MLEKGKRIQEDSTGQGDEARELLEQLEHGLADSGDGVSDTENAPGLRDRQCVGLKPRKHRLRVLLGHDVRRHAPPPRVPQQKPTDMVQCVDARQIPSQGTVAGVSSELLAQIPRRVPQSQRRPVAVKRDGPAGFCRACEAQLWRDAVSRTEAFGRDASRIVSPIVPAAGVGRDAPLAPVPTLLWPRGREREK